jgi:hypothetical protein
MVGKTLNNFYAIEKQESAERWIRASACRFAAAKPNNRFTHALTSRVAFNTQPALSIFDLDQRGTPICRSGEAYYPADWIPSS